MQEIISILEAQGNDWPTHPLFHGTHSRAAALSIVQTGLKPQGGISKWKGDLTSVKGRSYLSGSLFYVLAARSFAAMSLTINDKKKDWESFQAHAERIACRL